MAANLLDIGYDIVSVDNLDQIGDTVKLWRETHAGWIIGTINIVINKSRQCIDIVFQFERQDWSKDA